MTTPDTHSVLIPVDMLRAVIEQGRCNRAPGLLSGQLSDDLAPIPIHGVCPFCDAALLLLGWRQMVREAP